VRLVARYQEEGDAAALEELMRRYHPRIVRKVRVLMGARVAARHEPEDITQSVIRTGLEHLHEFEFREEAALIHWLTAIAVNKIRSLARGRALDEVVAEVLPDRAGSEGGPEESVLRAEADALVDRAVAELPPDRREVILARDYEGGSWAHVADRMDRSEEACQMLHHRARVELRRRLRGLDPGQEA
jgi:RNA polymerase sigma factor (sigma-70 family)